MKKQYFKHLIASTLLFAGVSAQAEVKVLQDVLDRQVNIDVPAVKKGNVYGIYHTASRSTTDLASAQFMAKTLYLEQFKDIDPEKTYLDFHR